ncbi:hypothetical protein [Pseudomonas sp. NPDC099000]|uniref:hypothetical protein n=1 Tax=Pseudomonas sp. NPDC099000 TaxID=3364488 RepID=UPI00383A48F5
MSSFSWYAPIVPGRTVAGIELGAGLEDFKFLLEGFCVDVAKGLYKFPGAPLLLLEIVQKPGEVYFAFSVADLALTGWFLQFPNSKKVMSETRALVVGFLEDKVSSISVWMFDYFDSLGGKKLAYSYQGCLAEGIRLGSRMEDVASYYELDFDEGDEWFYTKSGGIIFGGGGVGNLEDSKDQVVLMIMVV